MKYTVKSVSEYIALTLQSTYSHPEAEASLLSIVELDDTISLLNTLDESPNVICTKASLNTTNTLADTPTKR